MLYSLFFAGRSRLARRVLTRLLPIRSRASLDDPLRGESVGAKAANLAKLRRWGYAVPSGWVWRSGDDRDELARTIQLSPENPVIVRSSAVGEDSYQSSAAGQYDSIGDIVDRDGLDLALDRCLASYDNANAAAYRRDRAGSVAQQLEELSDAGTVSTPARKTPPIALLVQRQIRGVISGVAFSRDPVEPDRGCVAIEVVCGGAAALVSGQVTPARYDAIVPADVPLAVPPIARDETEPEPETEAASRPWLESIEIANTDAREDAAALGLDDATLDRLLRAVAGIARQLEQRDRGTPQDIEWTYDGTRLWLLQARPITTLWPLWTRRIAAEVAPGAVQPLSWSISQPLTCGVWGEIFSTVLGDRADGLDFRQTATLHGSHAYFNASLLGDIFLRMGLPPESLEFLLRDRPMSRPSLRAMLVNVPGLLRLVGQQFQLKAEFARDDAEHFTPLLDWLTHNPIDLDRPEQTTAQILARADRILATLRPATHYNILVPIGLAIRQKLASVDLDGSAMPEVQATQTLQELARDLRPLLTNCRDADCPDDLRAWLIARPGGTELRSRFDAWLDRYGYLSDVGTNIAVPTWRETPERLLRLWWQTAQMEDAPKLTDRAAAEESKQASSRSLREFVRLKGRVAAIYDRLLAELRWCFVAIEQQWRTSAQSDAVVHPGDIFFLTLDEVCQYGLSDGWDVVSLERRAERIRERRERFEHDRQRTSVPRLVYGDAMPKARSQDAAKAPTRTILTGIGASRGRVRGRIEIVRELDAGLRVDRETILVVPYTDAGWSPLLSRAGGLISAVGGRLSHGAIVAREYGIPAVMDVTDAFEQLQTGQWVWLDGESGAIEPVSSS